MTKGNRSNIYLQADALRNLEVLFLRLQAAGAIPANETIDNIGKYRSKLITYAVAYVAAINVKSPVSKADTQNT